MGHAHTTNISVRVNRLLHRQPTATIRQMVDLLEKEKQAVHAGEGNLTDRCMLAEMCQQVLSWLYEQRLVEPLPTRKQKKVFKQWLDQDVMNWDCGDDGEGGAYALFDNIKWKALKKRLPILNYMEN